MKNKIISGIVILSILLIVIIVIINQVPKTLELTTFEKAYNLVQKTNEECIEIPIYINHGDSYLVKLENIEKAVIRNDDASLTFKVIKIEKEEDVYLKNRKFYQYLFILSPTITLEDDYKLEMDKSILELSYAQGANVSISIGSFSYYYFKKDEHSLSLKQLKGLVNTYDDKMLVGIMLGLKNNSNNIITIKNIIPLDTNVIASLSEVKYDQYFNQGDSIDEILGYKYNLYSFEESKPIDFIVTDDVSLFIPLKYKQNILLNKLGLLVEYVENGDLKYFCIDDFMFFETSLYSINKINNLKYHVYENY